MQKITNTFRYTLLKPRVPEKYATDYNKQKSFTENTMAGIHVISAIKQQIING